jgi:hypothetical protein
MFNMLQAYPRLIEDVITDKQVFVITTDSQDVHLRYGKISLTFGKSEIDIMETCIKTCKRIFASSAAISKIHWSDTTFRIKLLILDINQIHIDLKTFCKHRRVAKHIIKCIIETDIQMKARATKEQLIASKMVLFKTTKGSIPILGGRMILKDTQISPKVIINVVDECIS